MTPRVVDLGTTFGIPVRSVFQGKNTIIHCPENYNSFVEHVRAGIDLVLFGGGADIHPSIYNHDNLQSYCGKSPSSRDIAEVSAFRACIAGGIPVLAICRGAQLACAMAGGWLIQHAGNHAGSNHPIKDLKTGKFYDMTSAHHQMMYPYSVKHELVATVAANRSTGYRYDSFSAKKKLDDTFIEPEIVYFPEIKTLAVQGHPEFMNADHESVKYVRSLVNQYLLSENKHVQI